jgi:excinuclease UvrABC helicase subunit UvrB
MKEDTSSASSRKAVKSTEMYPKIPSKFNSSHERTAPASVSAKLQTIRQQKASVSSAVQSSKKPSKNQTSKEQGRHNEL